MSGFTVPYYVVVLGILTGLTYGVLAVGIVIVYRTNRIINFAHGQVGAMAAVAFGTIVTKGRVPYLLALPIGLAIGALTSAGVEVAVVRRLRKAPRLMSIIATLGAATVIFGIQILINPTATAGSEFPTPPGLPSFDVGPLPVSGAYSGMLFFSPPLVLGLAALLRWSRFGRALRAAASNPDAARLAGVYAGRTSTMAWMLAGAFAAFTAILLLPTQVIADASAFGPALMLRALAAAVVARMTNLPVALGVGVLVGVVENLVQWNYGSDSAVNVALLALVLGGLLLQPRIAGRGEEKGSWAAVRAWRPLPEAYRQVWMLRNMRRVLGSTALTLAVLIPVVGSYSQSFTFATLFGLSVVGLSLGVITGLAGQLSLGQFAIAAIGGWAFWWTTAQWGNPFLSILAGGVAGAAASVVVGLPALRIRGLMLAVTTLAFAFFVQGWLLRQSWALGGGVNLDAPVIGGWQLDTKGVYYLSLGVLVVALWLAHNVRRGGLGRIFVALRDNPDGARAFSIALTWRTLQAFAIAGFLAGVGGAVYVSALPRISSDTFLPAVSISLVAMAVLGGLQILVGPLIGVLYIFGLPDLLGTRFDSIALAGSTVGWLLLILYVPGGIAQVLEGVRDRIADALARAAGVDVASARADPAARGSTAPAAPPRMHLESLAPRLHDAIPDGGPLLAVRDVAKRYGGVVAVESVSLSVGEGEILGLIGPNGAGKTTLFELISGFVRPDSGSIEFAGERLSTWLGGTRRVQLGPLTLPRPGFQFTLTPELRARRGMVRSFQDAALFPTMTVFDVVQLALERAHPTALFPAMVGAGMPEEHKRERAAELLALMGLDAYRRKEIRELSTGTRRITEIACLVGLEPRLLLLDEPSSGIAQRETEALGDLLLRIRTQLRTTMIVIEHDIPLIMGIADRIVAMEAGRVIAVGSPADIRANELVIEAYLGGDVASIERSGALAAGVS
ncbi:MAG TPA: branched-chain amino acid ABC transporter permease/ATP-binding protein [Candidatus Dormibacteraeota bacterium]|nr:branched-chain amino acid ABC transporter permease/ATP-binding protein [Candidatus Dormibacteraeota bacterium]